MNKHIATKPLSTRMQNKEKKTNEEIKKIVDKMVSYLQLRVALLRIVHQRSTDPDNMLRVVAVVVEYDDVVLKYVNGD